MAFLVGGIYCVYADTHGISVGTKTSPVSVEESHPPLKKQKPNVERTLNKHSYVNIVSCSMQVPLLILLD